MKSQAKYPRNFREFPGPFRDFAKSLITQIHCNIHTFIKKMSSKVSQILLHQNAFLMNS